MSILPDSTTYHLYPQGLHWCPYYSGLAGLLTMRFRVDLASLLTGTIAMSMAYGWLGSSNLVDKHPRLGLLLSAFLPLIAWFVVKSRFRKEELASSTDGAP